MYRRYGGERRIHPRHPDSALPDRHLHRPAARGTRNSRHHHRVRAAGHPLQLRFRHDDPALPPLRRGRPHRRGWRARHGDRHEPRFHGRPHHRQPETRDSEQSHMGWIIRNITAERTRRVDMTFGVLLRRRHSEGRTHTR